MILRAAIVLLLMLNLGAAGWWWLGNAGVRTTPPAAPLASGTPRLVLLTEIASPPLALMPAAGAAVELRPTAATTGPTALSTSVTPGQCLRFGPFADAAARDAARPALAELASRVVARDIPGRASRGWWVFLPALASREEARALGERIKAAGISDWYVMNEGDQANSIALGRYGNEDAARRREADLRGKGFPAQAAPLGDRRPQWWLDARVAAEATPAALTAVGPSSEIACTGLR